jgi:hypothetical protein
MASLILTEEEKKCQLLDLRERLAHVYELMKDGCFYNDQLNWSDLGRSTRSIKREMDYIITNRISDVVDPPVLEFLLKRLDLLRQLLQMKRRVVFMRSAMYRIRRGRR